MQSEGGTDMAEISDDELERRMTAKLFGLTARPGTVAVSTTRPRSLLNGRPSKRDRNARREAEMVTYVDPWERAD